MRYILYARKSTESEERQVLSIEAQISELKEFAAKEKLEIVASLCEAQTAKEPENKSARTIFCKGKRNFLIIMDLERQIKKLYGDVKISPCPFTEKEISELEKTGEILVYLPANLSMEELCKLFGIKANVNFENEKMIRNVMVKEDQWFIASASKTPELIYKSAQFAERIYTDESLHGMDFRRYLAFAGIFKDLFGDFPDQTYWTFLLSGSYDRSGVSIVGFDSNGVLSHHGWMKDFKAKFTGSRYVVLAPRIEITPETEKLSRAYRGSSSVESKEASMD